MTKERLGKILFRCTLLIMCFHALGLIQEYGFNVPAIKGIPFMTDPDDHHWRDVIIDLPFSVSRWFDVFIWPILGMIIFLFWNAPSIGCGLIDNNFGKDHDLTPLGLLLTGMFITLLGIMVGVWSYPINFVVMTLMWGSEIGLCYGLFFSALAALVHGFPVGLIAVFLSLCSLPVCWVLHRFHINVLRPMFLLFVNFIFAVEEEKKEGEL